MKTDIYKQITDQIIDLMESHGTDWSQPWTNHNSGAARNIVSGKAYQGINIILLGCSAYDQNFTSNYWGTFKQWKQKGGKVKKGSKGTVGVFFKKITVQDRNSENPDDTVDIPMMRSFYLFNADQVEGVEIPQDRPLNDLEKEECAECLLAQAEVRHGGNRAFYSPREDFIAMPQMGQFDSSLDYYSTALHELTHWTGHKSRCDRIEQFGVRFGDERYAMEELVAEIGSCYLTIGCQITHTPKPESAKYLNNWLKVLKNDKKAFAKAAAKAQQAADYLYSKQAEAKAA